jgi:RNA polymerase sigma-70 factor (ECF subfamily)
VVVTQQVVGRPHQLVHRSTQQSARHPGASPPELPDDALISLVARSDTTALGALYDRYGRIAYGLALRVLRDPTLAEDAVQDAFLAIWRSAGGFDPRRASARTWLLTLVHRRAVDLVRREECRRRGAPESPEQLGAPATDEEAAVRAQRRSVQQALAQLPHEQRELLELAYYGGFTQSELARRLGLPLGTIKSRMFTGLGRLRELLPDPADVERRSA